MNYKMSNCVAWGVGDKQAAADFYGKALGFEVVQEGQGWLEVKAGELRVFLCEDEVKLPVFDLTVPNIDEAREHLLSHGYEVVELGGASDELFMRDPFGYVYCVSPQE